MSEEERITEETEVIPSRQFELEKVRNIGLAINELLGDKLVDFNGILAPFEKNIPLLLSKNLSLYYKEFFKITENQKLFKKKLSSKDTPKMEKRVLNVISSYMKHDSKFNLESILEIVSEKDENLVIEALEDLIKEKIIEPTNI